MPYVYIYIYIPPPPQKKAEHFATSLVALWIKFLLSSFVLNYTKIDPETKPFLPLDKKAKIKPKVQTFFQPKITKDKINK